MAVTEDLPALATRMVADGTPFYQAIPGLWYDRRRDEHSMVIRPDANVWAPFYEMPWARSGSGVAADGLSRFDLTRFNPWYYERFKEFGRLCGENGLVLYHNLYNTHNVLEIYQHWFDYPYRPINNINDTGLPGQAWCLADDRGISVLLYSLAGPTVALMKDLGQDGYSGIWFDRRSGKTQPLESLSGKKGAVLQKPAAEPWLLLLRANKESR